MTTNVRQLPQWALGKATNTSPRTHILLLLGGLFLSEYMAIHKSFITHSEQPPGSISHYIESAADPKTEDDTIIFQSNGLSVVERQQP